MAIANTDKFLHVGNPGTATTLASPGYTIGNSSITVASTTNFPTDTAVIFSIDTAATTTGTQVRNQGSYCVFVGIVTGAQTIGSLQLLSGTPQNYAASALTRVYITVSSIHTNRLVDGILSFANQDGSLKSTAVQTALGISGAVTNGWNLLNAGVGPNTVTYIGNRSYTLQFNGVDLTSVISAGMRLLTTRTVAAPTQSTSLNGTTQYYSKTSPAGMTFTDDFVAGAWVKLGSYPTVQADIITRYNGTSGWELRVNNTGRVELVGNNAGSGNYSEVISYQSIPLNKWVHISAQLDMSAFTVSNTTSYIMIDGVDVPAQVVRGGTNPTALVQAGNLEVGSVNSGTFLFPGKIAQAFVTSAKLTQTQVRAIYSQGLTSADMATYSIVSAYSFNNTVNDINTTNANNLTQNGSATATNPDSPFGNNGTSSTLDYAIVSATPTFSTNTTVTVQVPEGCTIPTSGGVANVQYSSTSTPYGFPRQSGKWKLSAIYKDTQLTTSNATYGPFVSGSRKLTLPVGEYSKVGWKASLGNSTTTAVIWNLSPVVLTGLSASAGNNALAMKAQSSAAAYTVMPGYVETAQSVSAQADYVLYSIGTTTGGLIDGSIEDMEIFADNGYL